MSATPSGRADTPWLALLRGINVVGKNKVPMKALAGALESAGLRSVRTYIQSGNVVFRSSRGDPDALAKKIAQLVARKFACAPMTLVISKAELAAAIRGNPFPEAQYNHKLLHIYFLASRPKSPGKPSRSRAGSSTSGRPMDSPTRSCNRGSSGVWASPPPRATGARSMSC
ncbi:MAG TPA: DUF1697 domain-containing protein [Steroidobacteraceae bacterium]|jgi:hypothetical protein